MPSIQTITPCLWFNHEAQEAANYYVGIFPDAKISEISYYAEAGREIHGREPGSVMMVAFELAGQTFTALNGGPNFKFNEAISFQIYCNDQKEVDHYWNALTVGGDPNAQQCSWLKDKFGVSWQVVPRRMIELLNHPDKAASGRAMLAMMGMKKIEMADIERAFAG